MALQWLDWFQRLQAIAQTGLTYAADPYDIERYEQIRKVAVMSDDFPTEVRSINHFQKVKVDRDVVATRYQRDIEAIYSTAR